MDGLCPHEIFSPSSNYRKILDCEFEHINKNYLDIVNGLRNTIRDEPRCTIHPDSDFRFVKFLDLQQTQISKLEEGIKDWCYQKVIAYTEQLYEQSRTYYNKTCEPYICPPLFDNAEVCIYPVFKSDRINFRSDYIQQNTSCMLGFETPSKPESDLGLPYASCNIEKNSWEFYRPEGPNQVSKTKIHDPLSICKHLPDKSTGILLRLVSFSMFICSCLSILLLVPSIAVFLFSKRLKCTRNFIHCNLMIAYLLKTVVDVANYNPFLSLTIRRDDLFFKIEKEQKIYSSDLELHPEFTELSILRITCLFTYLLEKFCQLTTYTWLLNEGIYLYNLLNMTESKFLKKNLFFAAVGWIAPTVVMFIFVIYLVFGSQNPALLYQHPEFFNETYVRWIIEVPKICTFLMNLVIFACVAKTVYSKVKADHRGTNIRLSYKMSTDSIDADSLLEMTPTYSMGLNIQKQRDTVKNLRLLRAILLLVPLLGIHHFNFVNNVQVTANIFLAVQN